MLSNSSFKKIPLGVWSIGLANFFMTLSTIMLFSLMPLHMKGLGASTLTVGFIEGFSEFIALATRVISGVVSDWLRKRKLLLIISYGLISIVRPFFAMATTINMIIIPRLIDRVGNGLFATPRDALVGDLAPKDIKGACFGLRESLTKAGSFIGAFIAFAVLYGLDVEYKTIFWVATIPAFIALITLLFFVKEPPHPPAPKDKRKANPLTMENLKKLPTSYWALLGIVAIFVTGRCGEAFISFKGNSMGTLPAAFPPLAMSFMNMMAMLSSYPIGALSDKMGRNTLLMLSFLVTISGQLTYAFGDSTLAFILGTALWGLQMGMTQSLFVSAIADMVPEELRGTGFGFYQLTFGVFGMVSATGAGFIWDHATPTVTFLTAAGITFLALVALGFMRTHIRKPS